MNVSEYIASGILEIYVLGELPPDEATYVEEMAVQHPEIQKEIQRIQETNEALAMQSSMKPRASLRNEILDQLAPEPEKTEARAEVEPLGKQRSLLPWQMAAAASILLAIASIFTSIYFRQQWKETELELNQVLAQNQEIASQYNTATQREQQLSNDLAIVTSPDFQQITLKGTDVSPNSLAQVFWNAEASQLYLNPGSLPDPPSGKQYQLWAIVDGQPVSAGVLDLNETQKLVAMQDGISKAGAFAITLEPEGGSESPTLEQMYVMGTVAES